MPDMLSYLKDLYPSSRIEYLNDAVIGLYKTGIPLVTYRDGEYGIPFSGTDDLGFYYFTSLFVKLFNLPAEKGANLLFTGLIVIASLMAVVGFFLLFKNIFARAVSLVGVCLLLMLQLLVGYVVDYVYIVPSILLCMLPLLIYLLKEKNIKAIGIILFIFGVLAACGDFIRGMSGIGVMLILVILILGQRQLIKKRRIFIILCLIAGFISMHVFLGSAVNDMNRYLESVNAKTGYNTGHVIWAQTYIGFGFLYNDFGIYYNDDCVHEKIRTFNPDLTAGSVESEIFFRDEVMRLIKEHPFFVIGTIFAKMGVITGYVLVFANVGLVFAFIYRKDFWEDLAFIFGIIFFSTYGILAHPLKAFILIGLFTAAALWGIYSICFSLESKKSSAHMPSRTYRS